ncbi:MAG TPA: NAD-dependent malic enzyme [Thermoleophilaceae bacterium]
MLGDPDPALAVQQLWDPQRFDEVIVSTLPARISPWLKLDLPRRVERITGRPVRHVTASQGHQGEAAGGRAPTESGEGGPMSDQSPKVPSLRLQPSASYSFTMRLHMPQQGGAFAHVAEAIAESEALLGAIDLVRVERQEVVRDVTVACADAGHAEAVVRAVRALEGVRVDSVSDRTFLMHKGGKIEVNAKLPLKTRDDLSMAYTPGVARVSTAIHEDPGKAWALTIKSNTVAVVSDGSAVLGLGDIGPAAAMPVMEGKAMLFKEFAGVDAFPLCIDLEEVDEIVAFVRAVAPTFGGINLEDIAAPRCFEIERRLRAELDIPVFHDDQHGTAIVVLAALLNALRVVGKRPEDVTVVVVGAGAAGVACTEILLAQGVGDVVVCNRRGALYAGAEDLDAERASLAERTNKRGLRGKADEVLAGAHVLLGLSGPGAVSPAGVRAMAPDAIVFAMANPVPEVHPEEVRDDVAVMATGRSDYPNQINNVLAFPGVFKGALEVRARTINEEMELAAAHAIAHVIPEQELHADYIIPSVFNRHVAESVADAVAGAAVASGVARRERRVHPPEPATPLEALR